MKPHTASMSEHTLLTERNQTKVGLKQKLKVLIEALADGERNQTKVGLKLIIE